VHVFQRPVTACNRSWTATHISGDVFRKVIACMHAHLLRVWLCAWKTLSSQLVDSLLGGGFFGLLFYLLYEFWKVVLHEFCARINLNQNQQRSRDFMPIEKGLPALTIQTANMCARENVYPYCNRRWNFLPAGSGISLPFRGPIARARAYDRHD
jgi:hypothetical protein